MIFRRNSKQLQATLLFGIASVGCALAALPASAALVTSGLTLHLDAAAGVTTDGSGNVSMWADQSGLSHDASQASPGSRPALISSGLNGLPVVRFDGGNDFMSILGAVLSSQQFTIMAVVNDTVVNVAGAAEYPREVISNWAYTNTTTSVFFGTTWENPVRARLTDDLSFIPGIGEIVDPSSHFIFTGVSGVSDVVIYQNDFEIAHRDSPLAERDLTTPWVLGTQGPLGFEFWQGDMAEVLVYDRELTSEELQQNWDALNAKYLSISAAVPEPASLTLWGLGALGCAIAGYRRRKLSA